MSITIDQILMLAGRLDDTPGFDTARERFRRFLSEYLDDIARTRALIEQCQHSPSEQHQRALQDLIVLLGRPLGFETTFGTYAQIGTPAAEAGHWLSRSRLYVALEFRPNGAGSASVSALVNTIDVLTPSFVGTSVRAAGLCVLATPVGRHKVEEAVAVARAAFPISVVDVRTLVSLAEKVSAGNLTHEHVLRVIEASIPSDFIVDVLEQSKPRQTIAAPEAPAPVPPIFLPHPADEPSYWIATIGPDHATKPEEFLELVVARRQILGIADIGAARATPAAGDGVCFYIAGKGVVGHARVASHAGGVERLRDAHRFKQVLPVTDVTLHLEAGVPLDSETELRMRTAGLVANRHAPTLVAISRESYATLTAPRSWLSAG